MARLRCDKHSWEVFERLKFPFLEIILSKTFFPWISAHVLTYIDFLQLSAWAEVIWTIELVRMSEIRANGHLFRFWWNHKHLQIFGNCDDHATFSTKTRLTLKKMAIGEKPNVARVKQRNSDTQKNAGAAIEFLKCERTETCIYLLFCCSCCCSSSNFSTVEKGHFTVAYALPCSYYTSAQLIAFHSLCVLPLLVYTIEMIFLIHWHVVNSFTKSSACSCSNMIIRGKKES